MNELNNFSRIFKQFMKQEPISAHSLSKLLESIKSVLGKAYNRPYWIKCEVARVSLHQQTGHGYFELVEKDEKGLIAQIKAICWNSHFNTLCKKFKDQTGSDISSGIQVLLNCSVNFHPLHGLSLTIIDIEPSFTLGELARMKAASIERLRKENIFDLNRKLNLPVLPGRLAIISVDTSRGYQDFLQTIYNRNVIYNITVKIFEAILQGDNAVNSIIAALEKIQKEKDQFDAVAIIRGGAGETGLACYDEYSLSAAVAKFPLPVLTGIGHSTNETVVEMVAYKSFITPTAAAGFILDNFIRQDQLIEELQTKLIRNARTLLSDKKLTLDHRVSIFESVCKKKISNTSIYFENISVNFRNACMQFIRLKKNHLAQSTVSMPVMIQKHLLPGYLRSLNNVTIDLKRAFLNLVKDKTRTIDTFLSSIQNSEKVILTFKQKLNHLEEKVSILDPANILRRGYSVTRINGKAIIDANDVKTGDEVETTLAEGKIISTVK